MAFNCWMRLVALTSSCVTFGLVTHAGGLDGGVGRWCMFCWTFSFCGTLVILLGDRYCIYYWEYVRSNWANFSVAFSSYAALLCLFASITFPLIFLKDQQNYDVHRHLIAAEFFSCVAMLAYLLQAWIAWVESLYYMATTQGVLLVWQTYVAGLIFFFISNPVSYTDQAAVRWCIAVYCICFICSVARIIENVVFNVEKSAWFKIANICAAVMYFSATIAWPVFKFNSHYPSEVYPPEYCHGGLGLCPRGRLVVVTVLTAINFLFYSISLCTSGSTNGEEECTPPDTSAIQSLLARRVTYSYQT